MVCAPSSKILLWGIFFLAMATLEYSLPISRQTAASILKSIYHLSALGAGLEVSPTSPEGIDRLLNDLFSRVNPENRVLAMSGALKVIAGALDSAHGNGYNYLGEGSVEEGKQKVCPVYPFD